MNLLFNQEKAIKKLSRYKVGALFMEAGTGKTLTACRLIESRKEIKKVLWFTPFRTKDNLKEELNKIGFEISTEIVGIESLSNSDTLYMSLIEKYKGELFFCVLDESLKIKNDSKRYKRITTIGEFAKYRIALNGTPISKNYLDLYNQMDFLSTKILKMSKIEYIDTFVEYTLKKKGNKVIRKYISGYENLDYLFKLIKPFIFESKLNLEVKKEYETVHFNLDEETLQMYSEIKQEMLREMQDDEFRNFLSYLQKLQHSYSICKPKIYKLKELMKELDVDKTLIFCKYIDEQEELKKRFPDYKILSLQKHSFGLNLQAFNTIIFFNHTWDYALIEQAERRIYRTGQKENCKIINFVAETGIDNLIVENLSKKEDLLSKFKKMTIEELENKI